MKITKQNYEIYFVDLLEGKLSAADRAEVMLFLEQHPDLKAELDAFNEAVHHETSVLDEPFKTALKKTTVPDGALYTADLFIRNLEGIATFEEQQQLAHGITVYPELQRTQEQFALTIQQPDKTIVFPGKQKLKKRERIVYLYYRLAAAASIVALLGIAFFFSEEKKNGKPFSLAAKRIQAPVLIGAPHVPTESVEIFIAQRNPQPKTNIPQKEKTEERNSSLPLNEHAVQQREPVLAFDTAQTKKPAIEKAEEPVYATVTAEPRREEPAFLSIKEFVTNKVKRETAENTIEVNAPEHTRKKLSGWDLAAVGTKVLSKVTGKKIVLEKKYNDDGEVNQFALVTENFEFSKKK